MTKRRQISLLPFVHQTEDLKRFFNSTVDQLFEEGKTVPVSGYIGRKPAHYDAQKDFYKPEPTPERERYQLEPMMVSHDDNRNVISSLFYEDLIANLSQMGALVDNPNRLFGAGYYSWAPPIDIDRIMNFQQYYWSGLETNALVLTVPGVEVGAKYYGDGFIDEFAMPVKLASRTVEEEVTVVLVNGEVIDPNLYTVASNKVTFDDAPAVDSSIVIFRYGNVGDDVETSFAIPAHCPATEDSDDVYVFINGREITEFTVSGDVVVLDAPAPANSHVMVTRIKDLKARIEGHPQFDPTGLTLLPVTELVEGMKLKLVDPINFMFGYDLKAYGHPWDELGHSTYFVEGVDIEIVLIPIEPIDFSGDGFAADDPRYVVIARTDPARSFWSRVNRWVHKDALIDPADAKPELQAKRPIIEFLPGLQQFNYGTYRVSNSSGKISTAPRYNGNEISFSNINGIPEGELVIDDDFRPQQGDVLFVNFSEDTAHNNRLYRVDIAQSDGVVPISLIVLEPLATLEEGAVTQIKEVEYWYDGRIWHAVPEPDETPLFDLFDKDGISLADVGVYPETDFEGSRIFSFADGTGRRDSILKKALRYDKFGQIVFENELHTRTYSYDGGDIGGYYYYKRGDTFLNAWHKAEDALVQAIDDNNVSDIPLNLQANPDFDTPEFLSRNDFFEHFASILKRQDNFTGQAYSRNNWYKTAKDVTKGLVIIQHEAPLLKLMALMAEKRFNLGDAMRFVEREYTRLKAKFIKHVMDLSLEEDITILPADTLAVKALNRLNAGKTTAFPFHDTGVGGGNFFIPVTPSLLGINPLVEPALIIDDTFGQDVTFIRGHDGSMTAAWGDIRDDAMLALEQRIYTNALEVQEKLRWDDIVGGAFRSNDYSETDAIEVMMPWFERWARENDAKFDNVTFDQNDPFTWNYRTATDRYGNEVPGHWRGIYLHFFDTDRPHLAPWEMLGFAQKPAWWETFYGPAPYTRSNSVLWEDIAAGIIRDGDRAGTHAKYARDDLMQILPVGLNGELLDPITATIIPVAPPVVFAEQSWTFGDGSNVEAVWRMTSNYRYARAFAKFLMRPAYFVEVFWDILNETVVHEDQKVQTPQYRRVHHAELLVHGEENADGEKQVNFGIQNWLVDYMRLGGSNSIPLGDAIRGVKAQLGHKVAGFTTKDRMTISAESFGLVPDEDITISLYRSPSLTDFFYSGVIVENTAGGYRVVGYNPDYPFFDVILGEEHSKKMWIEAGAQPPERAVYPWKANVHYKQNMLIEHENTVYRCETAHTSGSQFEKDFWKVTNLPTKHKFNRVFKHTKSSGVHARIEYGTILQTKQEVADLMFGYERYLKEQGFVFADERNDNGSFFKAVKNFVKWAMVEWKDGAFVSLSPAARKLTFESPTGIVVQMENSVIDRTGHFIRKGNFSVDRSENITEISAISDDIYGARLSRTEIEHALVFSNETVFGDVIFNPLYNIRQYRLKMSARVAPNWLGRYEAPGFIIDGDAILPNFVKLGEDVREMFDIELADNTVLRDHARHVIGFETRDYLDKLLLNETQQFEMYQGMIQQKGSAGAMSAILRSGEIAQSRDLQFLEEWAFRVGDFGAFHPELAMELTIEQADIHSERQLVHLNDEGRDDWLNVDSSRWVSAPADFTDLLTPATTEALPDAGYARVSEATHMVRDLPSFSDVIAEGNIAEGQTIWTTHTDEWGMHRICWPTADLTPIEIQSIKKADNEFEPIDGFRILFDKTHTYLVGDTIILSGSEYRTFWGAFPVARVGTNWVELDEPFALSIDFEELEEFGMTPERPKAFVTRALRVTNTAARDAMLPFPNGTMSYVDNVSGKWVVYKKIANNWVEQRRQAKKIENKSITNGLIWDQVSDIEPEQLQVEPQVAERLVVIDPLAGLIAGVVDKELDFKLEYDPANYDEWDSAQVGYLWWDLSTARFLNTYTDCIEDFVQGDQRYEDELVYRNENWAKLTKTSTVDVYEWTRSLKAPEEGEFVTRFEYDAGLNKSVAAYYHWKLNAETTPLVHQRRISARSCSQIISNPAKAGVVWYAAMAPKAFVIAGTHGLFDDDGRVMQIKYRVTDYEGEEHFEWTLMRPGDKTNAPPTPLWNKLMDSARGYDLNLRKLPSASIHPTVRSGLGTMQSMFGDVPNKDARNSLITMLNYILSRTNHATVGNLTSKLSLGDNPPEYLYWSAYTDDLPLLPPAIEYDITVYHEEDIEGALNQSNRVLFDNRGGSIPSWSVWHRNAEGVPEIRKAYDYVVANRAQLADIFLEMSFKSRVLVLNDEEAFGFWTIWEKRGDGAWDVEPFDQFLYDGFTDATLGLVNAQKYRTRDFWDFYDWYADGEDADVPPGVVYATPEQRNVREGLNPSNTFVKVLDDKDHWSWSRWNGEEWIVVARELSTVQLSENFFTRTKLYGILDEQIHLNLADIPFRDGTLDLTPLINAVREHLLTVEEVNELWFSMIHFIHSRIEKVDWALKTSFINVMGFNERMWASPVAVTENMPLLLDYIHEVKPYRAKIRDVIRTAAPDIDVADTTVTDFDKPVYWDGIIEQFRVLDEETDADILSEGLYRHYTEVPENRRKFLMSVKWDRIWGENIEGSGAAERIMAFYQPGTNMRRQSLSDLLDLDFKGTIYDGSVFGDTDLDLILQGSNGDGSQISLGGFKLRDPHVAPNRPEELAAVGTHDGLLIRSHDRWTAGAPLHTVRHYDVERITGTHGTFDINAICESVVVFVNGVRYDDWTRDMLAHTVTVDLDAPSPIGRAKTVAIHGFGFAGAERIREQRYYVGGQTEYEFEDALGGTIEARINGVLVDEADVTADTNSVTLATATTDTDSIILTLYTTDDPEPTRMRVVPLTYNANKEWQLTADQLPALRPYHAAVIVEKNGLRLTPPRTYYASNVLAYFVDHEDAADIRVYDNRTGTSFPVVDIADIDNVTVFASEYEIREATDERFVLWEKNVVFGDPEAATSDYTIVVNSGADYTITDGGLLSIPSATNSDVLNVTKWDNDQLMDMRTHVFTGNPQGFYNLTTTRNGRAWLTIDGKHLVENVDYVIEEKEAGSWDIDPFERFVYDSYRLVQIAIRFPGEQPPKDVVISTFEGREAHPARVWQISTKAPEEMRLVLDEESQMRVMVKKAWELAGLDYIRRSGGLVDAIEAESNTIVLALNPLEAPEQMIPPQPIAVPANEQPEVIWIRGERIEYFGYARSDNVVTLSELRRGTRGTAMAAHDAGQLALAIHDLDRMPPAPKAPPRIDDPLDPTIDSSIKIEFIVEGEGEVENPIVDEGVALQNMTMAVQGFNADNVYEWTNGEMQDSFLYNEYVDADDNIFLIGEHSNNSTLGSDAMVAKYDGEGVIQWQKTLNAGIGGQGDSFACATSDTVGNTFVFGDFRTVASPLERKGAMVKFAPDGTALAQKLYSYPTDTTRHTGIWRTISDGTYNYVSGYQFKNGGGDNRHFLMKLDGAGDIVWQKLLNDTSSGFAINDITFDEAGNIVVFYMIANTQNVGVLKYSPTGTLLWNKAVETSYSAYYSAGSVSVDATGNIYACVDDWDTNSTRVIKLDSDGDLQWSKRFYQGDAGGAWYFELTRGSVHATTAGVFFISHMTSYNSSGIIIVQIDPTDGDILNQRMLNVGGADGSYPDPFTSKAVGDKFVIAGSYFTTDMREEYTGCFVVPQVGEAKFGDFGALSDIVPGTNYEVHALDYADTQVADASTLGIALVSGEDIVAASTTFNITDIATPAWAEATVTPMEAYSDAGDGWALNYGFGAPITRYLGGFAADTDIQGNLVVASYDEGVGSPMVALTKFDPDGGIIWERKMAGPSSANDMHVIRIDKTTNDIFLLSQDTFGDIWTMARFNSQGVQQYQRRMTGLNANTFVFDDTYIYVTGQTPVASAVTTLFKLQKSTGALVAQVTLGSLGETPYSINFADDGSLLLTAGHHQAGVTTAGRRLTLWNLGTNLTTVNWQRRLYITAGSTNNHSYGGNTFVDGSDIYVIGDQFTNTITPAPPAALSLFAKYDDTGAFQFHRVWGSTEGTITVLPTYGSGNVTAVRLDGDFVVLGNIFDSGIYNYDFALMRFNTDGDLLSCKRIGAMGTNGEQSYALTTDGNFLYISARQEGDTYSTLLMKLHKDNIVNGTYGTFTITDVEMTEYTDVVTMASATHDGTAPAVSAYSMTAGTYAVSNSNPGLITAKQTFAGSAGGAARPAWLDARATTGINFMTGEAWVNDTLVTDFSTIFDNFDGARMDSSGYDQTDGDGALQAKGALLTALAPLNWAVRAEADISPTQVNPFPSLMGAVDSTWDNGMELQFNTSFGADEFKATFSDNMGDYAEGAPFRSGVHVFAASNNPTTGWSLAIDGGSALHQDVQSVWTASKISFGSDTDNTGDMYDHFSGYQRIWQFYPLTPDEGLIDMSLNDGTDARPAWLHAEAEFGINFMVGEAYVTGRLYTDLSEILGGNFDPANLSASGYTQVDATDGMKVDFGLLNRMSRMDWAMCMEWNASGGNQTFNVIEGTGSSTLTGFEMWRSSANGYLAFGDYDSTYANTGTLIGYQSLDGKFTPATYKVAMSNNVEGWVASLAGQTATTSTGQTPPGTDHIAIACGLSGNMPADAINGTIKKIEFFPRMQAAQLQTLATVTLPAELPGYRGVGTVATAVSPTASLVPTMAAGTVSNDYILLVTECPNAVTVAAPSGYTLIGTGAGTDSKIQVFGRRATGSNPNPTVTRVGDHTTARILVLKNVITSGNPWEALATGSFTGDPLTLPALTTTVNQSLVLQFVATGVDSTATQLSNFTNASLRAYSDRMSTYQTTGDGGGFAVGGGWKETAGAVSASTVTHALSTETVGYVSLSIKPA